MVVRLPIYMERCEPNATSKLESAIDISSIYRRIRDYWIKACSWTADILSDHQLQCTIQWKELFAIVVQPGDMNGLADFVNGLAKIRFHCDNQAVVTY